MKGNGLKNTHFELVQKFKCESCGEAHTFATLRSSICLYGVFLLVKGDCGYIGTNCINQDCLKTIAVFIETDFFKESTEFLNLLISGDVTKQAPIKYNSTVLFSPSQIPELDGFDIHALFPEYSSPENFDRFEIESITILRDEKKEVKNKLFHEYYCSYFLSEKETIYRETVWWFHKEQIEDLLALELDKKIRIFPRYLMDSHAQSIIKSYCWDYYLEIKRYEFLRDNCLKKIEEYIKKNADSRSVLTTYEALIERDLNVEPSYFDEMIDEQQTHTQNIYQKAALFIDILALNIELEYLPNHIQYDSEILWPSEEGASPSRFLRDKPYGFDFKNYTGPVERELIVPEIPESIVGYLGSSYDDGVDPIIPEYEKMLQVVLKNSHSGGVQALLQTLPDKFIQDYIKLVTSEGFTYSSIWNLKRKYLKMVRCALSTFQTLI